MNSNLPNKFNNSPSFISTTLSLQNTKYFLETYKSSKNNALFSKKFLKECPLYSRDSQIPESFYKLHKPFDRNLVFYIAHGPYGSSRRNYDNEEGHKLNEKVQEGEKDFMMNDLVNKVWSMKLYNENMSCIYGPYSSQVVFQFLKNYYIPMNLQEQKKMNLLITDIINDIYYQPESLYQMLQNEFNPK